MLSKLYLLLGLFVVALYGAAAFNGWEMGGSLHRQTLPSDVRQSPGGYRSFHFWHSGFHGGK